MNPETINLQKAASYLNTNAELREMLQIASDAVLIPQHLGEGEHNLNYRFDDPKNGTSFVLRINVTSQPFHKNQVRYEFNALQILEPSGCTPKPLYLDDSDKAPGKGAMVISFCEGHQLDFDNLKNDDLRNAAQMMANIHAVSIPANCTLFQPVDPLRTLYEECQQRFDIYRSYEHAEKRILNWVDIFTEAAKAALDVPLLKTDCTHIVNTETLPSHFLIPDETNLAIHTKRSGYFVDWERPIVSEVAQDVAFFTCPAVTFWDSDYLFPSHEINDFIKIYWDAVNGRFQRGGFDERFNSWRKMTALRSFAWCCRALTYYGQNPALHQTAKTMRKLETYVSDEFNAMLAKECFGLDL